MTDIAELYTTNHAKFVKTAKEHTKKVMRGTRSEWRYWIKYLSWLCHVCSDQFICFSCFRPFLSSTLPKTLSYDQHIRKKMPQAAAFILACLSLPGFSMLESHLTHSIIFVVLLFSTVNKKEKKIHCALVVFECVFYIGAEELLQTRHAWKPRSDLVPNIVLLSTIIKLQSLRPWTHHPDMMNRPPLPFLGRFLCRVRC